MALPNGVKHERALGHYVVSLDGLELSNYFPPLHPRVRADKSIWIYELLALDV